MRDIEEKQVRLQLFLMGIFCGFFAGIVITLSVMGVVVALESKQPVQTETGLQIELRQTEVDSPDSIEIK